MDRLKVNILGGRDVGKTTIAMHAAAELRWLGIPTALNYGSSRMWCEGVPIVVIDGLWRDPNTLTPHEAAEMCRGTLTFLVLRRKDYVWKCGSKPGVEIAYDERLEETLRSGRVRYKSLPGCRASVQYVVKRVCERVGYDR